ncbi:DsbA family protein [Sphingomonas elodea]|uniref:DsbA family protein n=1 Tax=Sphingomonas elodea TaxID=179878 RepID=UPI0002630326|nr:thioredoxin domain-containing protein [Sphingomonas elodea]
MMQRRFTLMLALVPIFALGAAPAPQPNWLTTVVATPEGGYRQGNPNAPIKLIEYGSRTCPTCYQFAETGMKPLRDQYIATGKVSYEYRDYLVHGAPDLSLALLNQCVGTARFFPVLDAIYANQPKFEERLIALGKQEAKLKAWQKLPPAKVATNFADALGMIAFLKTQGLPEAKARQCLADPKAIARIAKTYADGAKLHGVNGTPSFFVNGRRVSAISWPYLESELRAAGA